MVEVALGARVDAAIELKITMKWRRFLVIWPLEEGLHKCKLCFVASAF